VETHKHIFSSWFVRAGDAATLAVMKTIAAPLNSMTRAEPDERDAGFDASAPETPTARDVPVIVGSNLRRLRKAQSLSLERLAELSGVSRAMLGQIETAKSVPTVSLLWRVADALGVPVATLVATESEPTFVVLSREAASVLITSDGRYATRNLAPNSRQRSTGFFEITVAPGHREPFTSALSGTRYNLVVSNGQLTVSVTNDATPVTLTQGDAIAFEAESIYAIENKSTSEVTAYLVVVVPAP
jgi:transcriptional regulator with XRE-family HTH domain